MKNSSVRIFVGLLYFAEGIKRPLCVISFHAVVDESNIFDRTA